MTAAAYPTLPVYRGLPVPFVTRRVTEIPSQQDPRWGFFGYSMAFDALTGDTYPVLMNERLFRDDDGWLWQPAPEWDLDARPEWKAVHPERHRLCMDDLLCQVCGASAAVDGESSWLVPTREVPRNASRTMIAKQPPVCSSCLDLSHEKCPHVAKTAWTHVLARETRRWGVTGDVYDTSGNIVAHANINAQRQPRVACMTLARQRLIELTDWRLP